MHVVRPGRLVGDQRVEFGVLAIGRVGGRLPRRRLGVRLGQERQQVAAVRDQRMLVGGGEVGDSGSGCVRRGAAEVLEADVLAGDRLHHLRAGDEHVRGLLDHHHEVGDRRRIHRTAGARPHHQRDLRNHAGGAHVAGEDVGVSGQRDHALLDPRAARVVDSDDGTAVSHRHVHDLDDLLGKGFSQGAAEDSEVLREHEHPTTFDSAVPSDHAVAVRPVLHHAEVRAAMLDKRIQLDERPRIEQRLDALAGEQLALRSLAFHRGRSGGVQRLLAQPSRGLRGVRGLYARSRRAERTRNPTAGSCRMLPQRDTLSVHPGRGACDGDHVGWK